MGRFSRGGGQKYWQVLPLGPTSYGDSPYQSFSAFAGNPYFVDLEFLCEQGLLKKGRCKKGQVGEKAKPRWTTAPSMST